MKQKHWILIIVVLVGINLLSVGMLWRSHFRSDREMNRRPPKPEMYLKKRLGFSDEQLKQMGEMREEHFQQVQPVEQQLEQARRRLFTSEKLGDDELSQSLQGIGKLQYQLDSLTFQHFQSLRSICNNDQIEKFDVFIKEMANRRFGHGPGPRMDRNRP